MAWVGYETADFQQMQERQDKLFRRIEVLAREVQAVFRSHGPTHVLEACSALVLCKSDGW